MNNLAQELSDAQLDDYDCHKPKKKHCESPWERWYDRAHDYFENKY